MELLQTLLSFVVAIMVLVSLHEYGHYWVARRCGVKVLRFSIGFGKPFYTWVNKAGTEFTLAPIPLGGYVKMLDEREGEVPDELLDQAFTRKSVYQRIAIVAAGPVANFLLAVVLYWVVFLPGVVALSPVIGKIEPGSLAERAGLEVGQEVVAIDGVATPTRRDMLNQLVLRLGETGEMIFTVTYPGSTLEYETSVELHEWLRGADEPDPLAGLGIEFYRPQLTAIEIAHVVDGEAAAAAGLAVGDKLLSVDGETIESWSAWAAYVRARAGQPLQMQIERGGKILSFTLTPRARTDESGRTYGFVGIAPKPAEWPEGMVRHYSYGVAGALLKGAETTWDTSVAVLVSVKKLLLGEISTKNLSGPITIAKVAGDSANHGLLRFIEFLAMISVFLGVFNLLPIPVLDGGHLLFYLVEAVKGSPVSEKIQVAGYQLGLAVMLCLMTLAFYNDIMRL